MENISSGETTNFRTCPNCGWQSLRPMKTHAYCIRCGHREAYKMPMTQLGNQVDAETYRDYIDVLRELGVRKCI